MNLGGLENGDWLTIVGWVVSFALGLASALIVQRRGKVRRIVGWSVARESNLLSKAVLSDMAEGFQVPIELRVDGQPTAAVSTVTVAVANIGNATVSNATLYFRFGEGARVYVGRFLGRIGAYKNKLQLEKKKDTAVLSIEHINPSQSFEKESSWLEATKATVSRLIWLNRRCRSRR